MEPPGTAPGSDPLITSAFMSIVPKDSSDISNQQGIAKIPNPDELGFVSQKPSKTTPNVALHIQIPVFASLARAYFDIVTGLPVKTP